MLLVYKCSYLYNHPTSYVSVSLLPTNNKHISGLIIEQTMKDKEIFALRPMVHSIATQMTELGLKIY